MNFGTRDLRHANLSHRAGSHSLPPSPAKVHTLPPANTSQRDPILSPAPTYANNLIPGSERTSHSPTAPFRSEPLPSTISVSDVFSDNDSKNSQDDLAPDINTTNSAQEDHRYQVGAASKSPRNNVGSVGESDRARHSHSNSLDTLPPPLRFFPSALNNAPSPLMSTFTGTPMVMGSTTGTRYGAALTGQPTGSSMARALGSTTPICGKCGKSVYFAEQVKAAGKTYHKGCLRCAECNTLLDSTRLTEKDGRPLCRRCYGKVRVFVIVHVHVSLWPS